MFRSYLIFFLEGLCYPCRKPIQYFIRPQSPPASPFHSLNLDNDTPDVIFRRFQKLDIGDSKDQLEALRLLNEHTLTAKVYCYRQKWDFVAGSQSLHAKSGWAEDVPLAVRHDVRKLASSFISGASEAFLSALGTSAVRRSELNLPAIEECRDPTESSSQTAATLSKGSSKTGIDLLPLLKPHDKEKAITAPSTDAGHDTDIARMGTLFTEECAWFDFLEENMPFVGDQTKTLNSEYFKAHGVMIKK